MVSKIKLINGDMIQTSDRFSGVRVLYATTRDGKNVYKAEIDKHKNIKDYNWVRVIPFERESGFAIGESRTHKKSNYLRVNTPKRAGLELHRLVASCWLVWPDDGNVYYVHHKNNNPFDNRADNLELVTPKQHAEIHKSERNK